MTFHRTLAVLPIAALLLVGCAPPQEPRPDPDVTDPRPPGVVEEEDCVVGSWALDVAAYEAESEAYLTGLGIPITDFAMSGAGSIIFTSDGLVSTDIALVTSGTLVAGDQLIPISVPSTYTAAGDWSRTDIEAIQLDNWLKVETDEGVPPDVDIPALDVTQLTDVDAFCSSDSLYLAGPGAPLGAQWRR